MLALDGLLLVVEIRLNKNNSKKKKKTGLKMCSLYFMQHCDIYGLWLFLKMPLAKQPQLFIRKCGPKEQRHNGDYKSR